jgi:hypothetical protein
VITLLAALAVPTAAATYLLARRRTYKPGFVPGGPLPKRRPVARQTVEAA